MEGLKLEVPDILPLLPVSPASYRDVILEPLKVLARGGRRVTITSLLAERLTNDAVGADALPLLAFTLSYLYQEFGAGGAIDVKQYERMGGIAGAIELALKNASPNPVPTRLSRRRATRSSPTYGQHSFPGLPVSIQTPEWRCGASREWRIS